MAAEVWSCVCGSVKLFVVGAVEGQDESVVEMRVHPGVGGGRVIQGQQPRH